MKTKMNIQIRKQLIYAIAIVLSSNVYAQWAGSSSAGEVQQSNVKAAPTDTKKRKYTGYMGYGIGGYTSSIVNNAEFIEMGNETVISSPTKTMGGAYVMGLLKRNKTYPRFSTGIEIGSSMHTKEQAYEYYSPWGNSTSTAYITCIHVGLGVPIRYNLVDNDAIKVYAQAVLGYGSIVKESDERFGGYEYFTENVFYGGGAIGVKLFALYGELGYNSTGYLRMGLAF
jgi:hypothetical protein